MKRFSYFQPCALVAAAIALAFLLGPVWIFYAQAQAPEDLAHQAQKALADGDAQTALRLAIQALDSGLAGDENRAVAFKIRGAARQTLGDLQGALADYSQALAIAPHYPEAYNNRGAAFFELGELQAAASDFAKALELRPDYAMARFNLAKTTLELGDAPAAARDLSIVIAQTKDNAPALYLRGRARQAMGLTVKAEEDYSAALALAPEALDPAMARGMLRLEQGQAQNALRDFETAIRVASGNAPAHYNKGIALERLGQFEAAEASYSEALRIDPALADAYNNRGALRNLAGRHAEALADLDRAVRLAPQFAPAYANRAHTYQRLGNDSLALADLSHALTLAPELPGLHTQRGQLALAHRDFTAAEADFSAALAQNQSDRHALLGHAEALLFLGQSNEATADLTELLHTGPSADLRAAALKIRGRARFISGEFDTAAEDFRQYLHLVPNFPYAEIWLYLAQIRAGAPQEPQKPDCLKPEWPCPVLLMLRGDLSAQALLKAAGQDKEQQCEALFAAGQLSLAAGARVEAVRQFQAVLKTGLRGATEYPAARAELQRLGF